MVSVSSGACTVIVSPHAVKTHLPVTASPSVVCLLSIMIVVVCEVAVMFWATGQALECVHILQLLGKLVAEVAPAWVTQFLSHMH